MRFLRLLMTRDVSVGDYFSLIGLLLPEIFVLITPLCLLITVIFVYHKLEGDGELGVLRSSGLSQAQLMRPALALMTVFLSLSMLCTHFVVPKSLASFRTTQHRLRYEFSSFLLKPGSFCQHKDTVLYVKEFDKNGDIEDIFIATKNKKTHAAITITAKKGEVMRRKNTFVLKLFQGVKTEGVGAQGQAPSSLYFQELLYDLTPRVEASKTLLSKPFEQSTLMLLSHDFNGNKAHRLAQIHQRFLLPFLCVIFSFIGLYSFFHSRFQKARIYAYGVAVIVSLTLYALLFVSLRLSFKSSIYVWSYYIIIMSIAALTGRILLSEKKSAFYKKFNSGAICF
jgi:lipopolysaccharide export system permease protein